MNKKLRYWITFTIGLPITIVCILLFAVFATLGELWDKHIDKDMRMR
jgi:hypothetical protein